MPLHPGSSYLLRDAAGRVELVTVLSGRRVEARSLEQARTCGAATPDNTFHQRFQQRNEIVVPAGKGKTSFIDVRNIAAVAALALTETGHANQAYDLTGSEALDDDEVAAILSQALGRPITYREPSLFQFICNLLTRLSLLW